MTDRELADTLAELRNGTNQTWIGKRRRWADLIEQQAAEIAALKAAQDENRLIRLLADLRYALGDDGKRMQDELVQFARELRADAERYETVRLMSTRQWADARTLNSQTGKPFDEIIDDMRPFLRPNHPESPDGSRG